MLDAAARILSETLFPASFAASAPPPVQLVGRSASLAAVSDVLWVELGAEVDAGGPEAVEEAAEDPVTLHMRNGQ